MINKKDSLKVGGFFTVTCIDKHGRIKWVDTVVPNLIVNEGLNHILNAVFNSATQVTTWFLGLKNVGAIAPTDTAASHPGWTENTSYSEANRPTWSTGNSTSQQVTNATAADFSINADSQVIAGLMCISDNTKGGAGGILMSAADFTGGNKNADNGDTLQVTYTIAATG